MARLNLDIPDFVIQGFIEDSKRFAAMANVCGPSEFNGVVSGLVTPAVPGPGVRIFTKSNRDLTGSQTVKKGSLVSWHGLRFQVSRVRLGVCYPRSHVDRYHDMPKFFYCNSVQVVH